MISLKNITLKNFMSVGNVTQAVDFLDGGLVLVLGNNRDMGSNGSRNGVGKTTIINAISYALYGNAITNIRRDNLINKTNNKNMIVTLEMRVNGVDYRIERGRKPGIMRFVHSDDNGNEIDQGQGDSRETQDEIERLIGLNYVMFKQIVALNTYDEPFLSLKQNDQRGIIEHLLGITLLSEKAETLKEKIRITKDSIKQEEYRIQGIESANNQIQKSIKELNIRRNAWIQQHEKNLEKLRETIKDMESFDIESELESHILLETWKKNQNEISGMNNAIQNLTENITRDARRHESIESDIHAIQNHECPECGQALHDKKHESILESRTAELRECSERMRADNTALQEINDELKRIGDIGEKPTTRYSDAREAYEYANRLQSTREKLESLAEQVDPHAEQIENLQNSALQEISWDTMNTLKHLLEHQEFLMKLLVNKDSFIRKRIIEQNLHYLNTRLDYYLSKLGLPHVVQFQSDLAVLITELGRELDFDNLSRGERNRLILGLSWSFRDVHESMHDIIDLMVVDELIDSGMDGNGVESALEVLKRMNRDRGKNIFLISLREELVGRVNNVLYVTKENGFTSFSMNQEFE